MNIIFFILIFTYSISPGTWVDIQLFRFLVSEKLRRISFRKCFNFAKYFETNPSLSVDGFTVAVGGGVTVEGFSFVSVVLFVPSSFVTSFSAWLLFVLLLLLLLLLLLFSLYLIPLLLTS